MAQDWSMRIEREKLGLGKLYALLDAKREHLKTLSGLAYASLDFEIYQLENEVAAKEQYLENLQDDLERQKAFEAEKLTFATEHSTKVLSKARNVIDPTRKAKLAPLLAEKYESGSNLWANWIHRIAQEINYKA